MRSSVLRPSLCAPCGSHGDIVPGNVALLPGDVAKIGEFSSASYGEADMPADLIGLAGLTVCVMGAKENIDACSCRSWLFSSAAPSMLPARSSQAYNRYFKFGNETLPTQEGRNQAEETIWKLVSAGTSSEPINRPAAVT